VAVAAVEFILVWNDLVVALLFAPPDIGVVGSLIHGGSRQFAANGGVLAATAVIVTAVPVAVVVAARRPIVDELLDEALR
jgi:ABC-type glycerol-3-phosphate transport system permease component